MNIYEGIQKDVDVIFSGRGLKPSVIARLIKLGYVMDEKCSCKTHKSAFNEVYEYIKLDKNIHSRTGKKKVVCLEVCLSIAIEQLNNFGISVYDDDFKLYLDISIMYFLCRVNYGVNSNYLNDNLVFFRRDSKISQVCKLIFNVLEKSRVSYTVCLEKQGYTKYFNMLNMLYIHDYKNIHPTINKDEYLNDKIQRYIKSIELFNKFNIVSKDVSDEFNSMNIFLSTISKRSDMATSLMSAYVLEKIIIENVKKEVKEEMNNNDGNNIPIPYNCKDDELEKSIKNSMNNLKINTKKIEKQDIDEINNISNKNLSGNELNIDRIKKEIDETIKDYNLQKSSSSEVETLKRTSTKFFYETVKKYSSEINATRKVFLDIFSKNININVKDGELDFKKQQSAYINSIVGESGNDYTIQKKIKTGFDLVILRDISGSTGNFKVEYAESIVVLMAALDGIEGVRTSLIEFESSSKIIKNFDDSLRESEINPISYGGTCVLKGLENVVKLNYKNDKRILIILSDGDYSENVNSVENFEKELRNNMNIKIIKYGIKYNRNGFKPIEVKDIPNKILESVIEVGIK